MKLVMLRLAGIFKNTLLSVFLLFCGVAPLLADDVARAAAAKFKQCVPCHGTAGEGKRSIEAPSIAGLPAWYVQSQLLAFKTQDRGSHPDNPAGMRMRAMANTVANSAIPGLSEHVTKLEYTPKTPEVVGDVAAGEALYGTCAGCHGVNGAGLEALQAPPLVVLDDWYIQRQLTLMLDGKRGSRNNQRVNIMLATVQGVFSEDKAKRQVQIDNLVAYIETLKQK